MSSPPCPSEAQLKAFQLGVLPETVLKDVAAHLEDCPRCETLARPRDGRLDPIRATLPSLSSVDSAEEVTWAMRPLGQAPQRPETASVLAVSPVPPPPMQPDEVGRLGPYRLRQLLSQGGMGLVFEAEDVTLHRPVALKVMKQELRPESEGWQRFMREARILASIKHDNLVTVYQSGQEGSVIYLAMELLQGESLDKRLQRVGPLDLAELLRVAEELTAGLEAIHGHGLIHRDLKPANIWIEAPSGRVKILDFGLARFVNDDTNLTQTGVIMGTPLFMSPEQAQGQKVDARSDLFSLGCVLYCLATGVKPFEAENTLAILSALALRQPQPVHELNPAIPEPLSELIMQLLAKDVTDRPASAAEIASRLRDVRSWLVEPLEVRSSSPTRPLSPPSPARPFSQGDLGAEPGGLSW